MNTAMTVLYGASPPFEPDPTSPWWPKDIYPEVASTPPRWDFSVAPTMSPCPTCKCHVRIGEPCPFCMKRKLDELEKRIDEHLKPKPAIKRKRRR